MEKIMAQNSKTMDYKDSGVDVEEGYNAVNEYKNHAKRTAIPGLLTELGSFNGMFEIPAGLKHPVAVSGTDGVGTKLDIAFHSDFDEIINLGLKFKRQTGKEKK